MYTNGRIVEPNKESPLGHISPLYGNTSVNFHNNKILAELFVMYNGAKKSSSYKTAGEDNQIYSADPVLGFTPAWATLNMRSSFTINKNIKIQLGLENILDKFYRVFASGISAPGRNFIVSVRGSF